MNWSAKGGQGRACSIEAKAFSFIPPHQDACGWHGTEDQCATSGELTGSPGWHWGKQCAFNSWPRPISESELASGFLRAISRQLSAPRVFAPGTRDLSAGQ
jgi:hypothetical protein